MVNFGPLTAEIDWRVCGTPAYFNGYRVLASSDGAQRKSTKLCTMLDRLLCRYPIFHYIYIFGGSCLLREFCQLQNSLCVQVLRSLILTALLQGTGTVACGKLCGVILGMELRNFRTWAQPIFGWAAITFGIGPHSSI